MAWHNVLITRPTRLSLKNGQLRCQQDEQELSLPLEDIASITLENTQTTLTGSLLSQLADGNTLLITCDQRHHPNGLLLPIAQHSRQLSALRLQIEISQPLKKRLWRKIVQQKINNQADVLAWQERDKINRLRQLAHSVTSGDNNNCEATAARLYFSSLFRNFKRHNNDYTNSALNYGYAIIRAAIARQLVAFGFHPCLGVHHCSELNNFNLADDLLEPFRPLVDSWTIDALALFSSDRTELDKECRALLTQALQLQLRIQDEKHTMQAAIRLYVKSLVTALKNKDCKLLLYPKAIFPPELKKMD